MFFSNSQTYNFSLKKNEMLLFSKVAAMKIQLIYEQNLATL